MRGVDFLGGGMIKNNKMGRGKMTSDVGLNEPRRKTLVDEDHANAASAVHGAGDETLHEM